MKKYLIIILLLLFIIITLFNSQKFIYYEKFKNNKRCLLLLYGQSFREGNMGTLKIDTDFSYKTQKAATESHINFIKHLKYKYDIDTDIIINTYDTKYEDEFKSWYGNNLVLYNKNKKLIGVNNLVDNIITKFISEYNNINNYDFVLLTRCDIYLKPEFNNLINPNWEKIMFVSQNWTYWFCGFIDKSEARVNPIIKFIPYKYFSIFNNNNNIFSNTISVDHDGWYYYKNNYNLINDDMDFMLDTYHDADSYKDFNPVYYMVSRPENQTWHDKDIKIDKSRFGNPDNFSCNKQPDLSKDKYIQHNI
jgi:hypothetical protein